MSARSESHRGDGLTFPAFFPAGSVGPIYAPADLRFGTVLVQAGVNPTTIDILVSGSSVLAASNQATGLVPAGTQVIFQVSAIGLLSPGASLQVTSTDGGALISLAFTRA